jgi:hypothetical protein
VIARLRLDQFGFDANRLPRLAAIGRAVQEAGGVVPRVPHIVGEQVSGDEDRTVLEHREIRLAAEQIELLRRRPRPPAVARAKQQRLLHDFVAVSHLLMKRRQQQLAVRHPGDARLVIIGFTQGDAFAPNWTSGKGERARDRDVATEKAKCIHHDGLIDLAVRIIAADVTEHLNAAVGCLD